MYKRNCKPLFIAVTVVGEKHFTDKKIDDVVNGIALKSNKPRLNLGFRGK